MQRRRAWSARLPRLLRGQPRNGVDRATVHLNLEMEVRPGRQAGRSNLADHLAGDHPRRGRHDRRREVAIEHTDVAVDGNGHVEAGAARVESHTDRAAGRGTDAGGQWGGWGRPPRADTGDPQEADHAACATRCSSPRSPAVNADSSLCAVFSAPPSAPGTLNTMSSEATANRR